jgi:hypothetical protein
MKNRRNRKSEIRGTNAGKKVGSEADTDPGEQKNVRTEPAPARGNGKTSGEEETGVKKLNGRGNGNPKKPRNPADRSAANAAPGLSAGEEGVDSDGRVVLQVRVRPELRREVQRLADEAGVTRQTYVLMALRDYGVDVLDEDLVDRRKGEHRARRVHLGRAVEEAMATDALSQLLRSLTGDSPSARAAIGRLTGGATGGGLTLNIYNYASREPEPVSAPDRSSPNFELSTSRTTGRGARKRMMR